MSILLRPSYWLTRIFAFTALLLSACGPSGGGGDGDAPASGPTPANQPPVANADKVTGTMGVTTAVAVLNNDRDPEGQPLRIVSFTTSNGGTVQLNQSGTPDDKAMIFWYLNPMPILPVAQFLVTS